MDMVFLLKCHLCVSLCFSCNIMLYFFKNYIYIYIYIYIFFFFLIFLYTAFPPAFPFFEGLFRIVPVSETHKRFPFSCNLALNHGHQIYMSLDPIRLSEDGMWRSEVRTFFNHLCQL
jgi:hypothetical protein